MDERISGARAAFDGFIFGGDDGRLDGAARDLDAVEADLAMARGRLRHAEFLRGRGTDRSADNLELALFGRAAELYRKLGDVRGEAEALFWIGCFHQVVRAEDSAAMPLFARSLDLATTAGDDVTRSYALRHLGVGAHRAGRLDEARAHLEESTRLRREQGMSGGVAANLVGLAWVARADGRHADATALIDEAEETAEAAGARAIVRQVEEFRAAG